MKMPSWTRVFRGKRVLIFGLGLHGGGAGAAAFFHRAGARVTVTDLKKGLSLALTLKILRRFHGIRYVLGRHRKEDFRSADIIIRNPGVPDNSPWLRLAQKYRKTIASDIGIFFRYCPATIVGITGTKGKSTAATLLYRLLKKKKEQVFLAGNIRKSVLELLPRLRTGDMVVLELSSFQLDMLRPLRISPPIAAITNIFPDHLNRYPNFAAYVRSKTGIFAFQKKSDRLFLNASDPVLKKLVKKVPGQAVLVHPASYLKPWAGFVKKRFASYQLPSIALAVAIARAFGVKKSSIGSVLQKYKPLPGRLETVRRVSGVTFVNDTTATNPGAAVAGLQETVRRSPRVILIAGGSDKKLDPTAFARAMAKNAACVVLLPGTATSTLKHIFAGMTHIPPIHEARTMAGAVRVAWKKARSGDTILLSPGAASFGLFENEFDRGDKFVHAVRRLSSRPR